VVGSLEGSFLGFLVSLTGAKTILEVGCFTGSSALAMAERLPEDGKLLTLDVNPKTNEIAQKFWAESPAGKKIQAIIAPALETMQTLKADGKKFDLIFIDADKPNYANYLSLGLELLSPQGFVIVDNCFYGNDVLRDSPETENGKAIRKFNHMVFEDKSLEKVLLPVRDGIYLIRKK